MKKLIENMNPNEENFVPKGIKVANQEMELVHNGKNFRAFELMQTYFNLKIVRRYDWTTTSLGCL